MSVDLSPCPISLCPSFRPADFLMCASHWGFVPAEMQKRFYASRGHLRKHGTPEAAQAHRTLIEEIVTFVEEKVKVP